MAKHRRFTGEYQAKVEREALRGERPIQDIAAKYGMHPDQVCMWSMPSNSIERCAWVTRTLPSATDGQTQRPFSRRFKHRQASLPSHQITLTRSPRRPPKTSRCPAVGIYIQDSLCRGRSASMPEPEHQIDPSSIRSSGCRD